MMSGPPWGTKYTGVRAIEVVVDSGVAVAGARNADGRKRFGFIRGNMTASTTAGRTERIRSCAGMLLRSWKG